MKQVTYDFDWMLIIAAIVHEYELDVEDGFWKLEPLTETLTGNFPRTYVEQKDVVVPGQVVRIMGFRLSSAQGFGPMTIQIKGGQILYGPDTDQRGPEESSGATGTDSGPARISLPPTYAPGF